MNNLYRNITWRFGIPHRLHYGMAVWGGGRGRIDKWRSCVCVCANAFCYRPPMFPNPMRLACFHPILNLFGFSHQRPPNSTGPLEASFAGVARP